MWRPPRVLVLDVEMFPTLAFVWRWWETGIIGAPVRDEMIVSFAYRWLHQKKTHVFALPDFKGYKKNKEDYENCYVKCQEHHNDSLAV